MKRLISETVSVAYECSGHQIRWLSTATAVQTSRTHQEDKLGLSARADSSEGRPWTAAKPFRLTSLRARHHFTELIDLLISAGSDSARFCSALARWVSSRFTLVRGNSPPVPSGVIKQIVLSWTHTAAAR